MTAMQVHPVHSGRSARSVQLLAGDGRGEDADREPVEALSHRAQGLHGLARYLDTLPLPELRATWTALVREALGLEVPPGLQRCLAVVSRRLGGVRVHAGAAAGGVLVRARLHARLPGLGDEAPLREVMEGRGRNGIYRRWASGWPEFRLERRVDREAPGRDRRRVRLWVVRVRVGEDGAAEGAG